MLSMQNTTPSHALEWRDQQPYSTQFEDVYFSSDNGLLETEYVFLQGNRLAERWQQLTSPAFTLIETGFGTGLNFLSCCQLWLQTAPPDATLHFISVEKYPLSLQDIKAALDLWPCLTPYTQDFLAHYPAILNGENIPLFNGRIHLTLLIGDAVTQLATLNAQADAWLLDGFAPSKNPDMWQPALFSQMARLSHAGTTIATFTSAGQVRRNLMAAGFNVQKRPGFGKKREMLIGHYANELDPSFGASCVEPVDQTKS
jgi:tRNA 5-methylaminomethyl-2-thiouridine biosynthesis bifunctional protein